MTPRKRFRTPRTLPPLDAETFARRMVLKIGTDYGAQLFDRAMDIIGSTGDAEPWIRAVQRIRDAGEISSAAAYFLMFKFAEQLPTTAMETDPTLRDITARIRDIEHAHGLGEDESWFAEEGPPEWQDLQKQWSARVNALTSELFARVGEKELAEADYGEVDPQFVAGRKELFPWAVEEDDEPGGNDDDARSDLH